MDEMLEVIEIGGPLEENTLEENISEEEIDLNVAGDEVSLEKDGESAIDVLDAAAAAVETPDTGTQTWVLILWTLVINSFYYLSRRKRKLLAL
jgi:hypothetical protein